MSERTRKQAMILEKLAVRAAGGHKPPAKQVQRWGARIPFLPRQLHLRLDKADALVSYFAVESR